MRSRNTYLINGLLVLWILFVYSGSLLAAEKGVFKGIDRFYGDTEGKLMFMEGTNLEYWQGRTYLRFAQAEIRETATGSREIVFQGGVYLEHEDLKVTGDRFTYNTEEESGLFTGHVVLERVETRDEQGKIVKEGLKLFCGNLDLKTTKKNFTARDEPRIEHTDFNGSGGQICYTDDDERLTFKKGFRLRMDQDELVGEEICFALREKTFEARRGAMPLEMSFEFGEKTTNKVSNETTD